MHNQNFIKINNKRFTWNLSPNLYIYISFSVYLRKELHFWSVFYASKIFISNKKLHLKMKKKLLFLKWSIFFCYNAVFFYFYKRSKNCSFFIMVPFFFTTKNILFYCCNGALVRQERQGVNAFHSLVLAGLFC